MDDRYTLMEEDKEKLVDEILRLRREEDDKEKLVDEILRLRRGIPGEFRGQYTVFLSCFNDPAKICGMSRMPRAVVPGYPSMSPSAGNSLVFRVHHLCSWVDPR